MDSKDNVIDTTLHRESKLGGQSQTSNQNAADLGKFIPGQLPLVSVKEEPSETVGSGTDFTKGHHAIVVAAQSAGHGQIDHSVRPLQIVEPANELSDILAPSGNREFWKSWSTDIPTSSAKDEELAEDIIPVSSSYLHSNATSHQWALGAIAELLDNAVDERENGATFVAIDKITNPRDNRPALLIQDNGGGMDPDCLRRCVSFGCSSKKSTHGKYGNGFKTGTMRLGADVIVFTASNRNGVATQSIGLVSTTFLREMGSEQYIFPVVDYEVLEGHLERLSRENEDWENKISALLEWSPYSTEKELLQQFDDLKPHGTKIIIYNLWCLEDGKTELDFDSDMEDILLTGVSKMNDKNSKPLLAQHIATRLRYSLRAYSSILYRRPLKDFKIILRGKEVEHYRICDELKFTELDSYKPLLSGAKEVCTVYTLIGFTKEAPLINVHGFNVYHKNRLILPFHRVFEENSSRGRGIVGVLEANCLEPTHNKQDFERTQAFTKIESRMKQLTVEYWKRNCINVGYAPPPQYKRKSKRIEEPPKSNNCSGMQELVPHPAQVGSSGLPGNTEGTEIQLVSPNYSTSSTITVSTKGTQNDQANKSNQQEQHIISVEVKLERIEQDLPIRSDQESSQCATTSSPNLILHSSKSPQDHRVASGLVYSRQGLKRTKISQPSPSAPLPPKLGPPAPVVPRDTTATVPVTSYKAAERAIVPTSQNLQSSSEGQAFQDLREENKKLREEIADYEKKEKAIRLMITESEREIQQLQSQYEAVLTDRDSSLH